MFTSRKILYFIILSLLIVCAVNGIDYRSNTYSVVEETDGTFMDFSDSGFFAVNSQDLDSLSVVTLLDEGNNGADFSSDSGYFEEQQDSENINIDNPGESTAPQDSVSTVSTESTASSSQAENTTASTTAATTSSTTASATTASTTQSTQTQGGFTTTPAPFTTSQAEFTTATSAPTTTTTTTTTTMMTTTEYVYTDSGNIHFVYSQVMIYAGANTTLEVNFPIGSQKLASFTSKDINIASVRNYDDVTALISGVSVGSTWIQATNSSGETAYCRVIVTDFAHEVIRLTNIERNNQGLPSLGEGIALVQQVADIRLSESMSYFSHTRPNGKKFSSAAVDIGLTYNHIGENLACGQTSPQQVVQEWMNSPTHRANILSPNYQTICVSYGIGSDGLPYWVQIFHTP